MRTIEFYLFNGGTYPFIPLNGDRKSNFIDLSSEYYEPLRGERFTRDYFETVAFAEELGFDGVILTEQHGGPIGLVPNTLIGIAWLAARTHGIILCAVGPILNAYPSPVRLAEEVALVDTLCGGRLIVGLPMGIGAQYHSLGVMNPAQARARFREAHDLFLRAMTEPGPFEWQGKFFHVPYVNPWPKPLQSPYPPIWIPAAGSRESLELCAECRHTYMAVYVPRAVLRRNVETFREAAAREGYEPDRRQIVRMHQVHVAETDAQARLEAEPHFLWSYQSRLRSPFHDAFPPGHVSVESLRRMALGGGYRSRDISEYTWEELWNEGWLVAGSPSTVAERLEELVEELDVGRVIVSADQGSMPPWLVRKSLTMFAEEVMPRFRPTGGAPVWAATLRAGAATVAEYGASVPEPKTRPLVDIPGVGVTDVQTAHVESCRQPRSG